MTHSVNGEADRTLRAAGFVSSGGGDRTHDNSVNSRALCQLSYPGPVPEMIPPPDVVDVVFQRSDQSDSR